MKRALLLFICTSLFYACLGNKTKPIPESDFRNKTFKVISELGDTVYLEFKDSTYCILNDSYKSYYRWNIKQINDLNFLILGDNTFLIEKLDVGHFDCSVIGQNDFKSVMKEHKPRWEKNQITGFWISKSSNKLYERMIIDGAFKNYPPPPPPPNIDFSNADYAIPSYYEISDDSIMLHQWFQKYKSLLEVNSTAEFLSMNLKISHLGLKRTTFWRIIDLQDDWMIVEIENRENKKGRTIDTLIKKSNRSPVIPAENYDKWKEAFITTE